MSGLKSRKILTKKLYLMPKLFIKIFNSVPIIPETWRRKLYSPEIGMFVYICA
jgi:TRAP-type mannitol/chloroaromatic compound transport system permease small subunit